MAKAIIIIKKMNVNATSWKQLQQQQQQQQERFPQNLLANKSDKSSKAYLGPYQTSVIELNFFKKMLWFCARSVL